MQLRSIVDLPGLFIGHDADNQWLYVDWKGEHDPDSSWAACGLMLESLRRYPCNKILNDNSNITRTTMQLSARSLEWLAQMYAAGLRHLAWVMPRELLSRRVTEDVVLGIATPHVATFDDVASAYVWLQQQPVAQHGPMAK